MGKFIKEVKRKDLPQIIFDKAKELNYTIGTAFISDGILSVLCSMNNPKDIEENEGCVNSCISIKDGELRYGPMRPFPQD